MCTSSQVRTPASGGVQGRSGWSTTGPSWPTLASGAVGFTRAELEAFRDADRARPGRAGAAGCCSSASTRGSGRRRRSTHFAHPGNRFYPALRLAGVIERDDRPRRRHERRRSAIHRSSAASASPTSSNRATAKASELSAAELRAGGERLRALRRASTDPGRGRRRHHRLPARRSAAKASSAAQHGRRSTGPSCGSSPTRAGSTPTRRSPSLAAAYRSPPRLPVSWTTGRHDVSSDRRAAARRLHARAVLAHGSRRLGDRPALARRTALLDADADIELIGVAGRHRGQPDPAFRPSRSPCVPLPLARPWLYESWNRFDGRRSSAPPATSTSCHSTVAIPAPSSAPNVVTVHDVAFVRAPERFTRHGARVMRRASSAAGDGRPRAVPEPGDDRRLVAARIRRGRIRHVPWGVDAAPVSPTDVERVRVRTLRAARIGSCCSSARSSRARTCARLARGRSSVSMHAAAARRRRRRTGGATATPARRRGPACGSSASCPTPTCRRCTPRPAVFAYPEPATRASGCPCSRRWRTGCRS